MRSPWSLLVSVAGPRLAIALFLSPPLGANGRREQIGFSSRTSNLPMMSDADNCARIATLEQCLEELEAEGDDPKAFCAVIDEISNLKKVNLKPGSSEWVAVVGETMRKHY